MVLYSTSMLAADGLMKANCACSSASAGANPCSCTNDQIDGWREKLTPLDSLLVKVTCVFDGGIPEHAYYNPVKAAEVSGEDITCHKTKKGTNLRVFWCTNKSRDATHYVHVTKVECGGSVPT